MAVKVTDIDEDGKVKLSAQDAQIGVELMATLSDDDGGVPNAAQITDQNGRGTGWPRMRLIILTYRLGMPLRVRPRPPTRQSLLIAA